MKMTTTNTKIKPAALVVVVAAFALVGGASVPSAAAIALQPPPIGEGDTSAQSLAQQIIDRTEDRVQDILDELGIDIDFADEPSNGDGPIVGEEPPCSVDEAGEVTCE